MDYFSIVNLNREPFSNSPDPDFFYQSRQHVACLQKLELALRLKRGLNVVIGAVGSGKTTLCRTLLKRLSSDDTFDIHLILDPSYASPLVFLETIAAMMTAGQAGEVGEQALKEQIKRHLYERGIDARKTVVLVIDEGQKLPEFCLEMLRELLNYETNDHKLLQIVLFAQEEFQDILDRRANLADRVNLIHCLGPMNYADTRQMIQFRVDQANDHPGPLKLFSPLALFEIYRATQGYPRKIINLCHQCILALIVQNRTRVNWRLVRSCRRRSLAHQAQPKQRFRGPVYCLTALITCILIGTGVAGFYGWLPPVLVSIGGKQLLATASSNGRSDPAKGAMPVAVSSPSPDGSERQSPDHTAKAGDGPQSDTGSATQPASRVAGILPPENVPELAPDMQQAPQVADPGPPSQQETYDDARSIPSLLGTLTVARNDTLGQMLMVVYGDFGRRFLDTVLDANPHIRHADAIREGDAVRFPAVSIKGVQRPASGWWIKVGDADSMAAAYRRAVTRVNGSPARRIIAVWHHRTGVQYGIYVYRYFFSAAAAEHALAGLPSALSETAEIISGWPEQTVFFSDPFVGKGRHG